MSFGGIVFELLSDDALQHDLTGAQQRYWQRGVDPRAIADVVCAVHVEASATGGIAPALRGGAMSTFAARDNGIHGAFDVATGTALVRARSLQAELSAVGAHRYAAAARIAAGEPEALIGLLRALTSAVVAREGGLMLHGAAVELDGEALLFLGPSGAGKSTAVTLSDGARCFAYDHLAVVPCGGRWQAWGLPGGTACEAPLASGVTYPVAAVLRVEKSAPSDAPRVQPLSGVQALFAIRESVECTEVSARAEDAYLQAVTKLSTQIAVGTLHTVLDRPHGSVLRSLLRELAGQQQARPS